MRRLLIIILSASFFLTFCSRESSDRNRNTAGPTGGPWLVPFEDILYWGDPADEILAIDDPVFEKASQSKWKSDDRMLVQYYNDVLHAYPVPVMEEHEIVNDRIGDYPFSVSYCPITGSGMSWSRTFNGQVTEFGVSGMLYHDNLVPYDRNTESYWSQMLMLCIHGEMIEFEPQVELLFETDFGFLDQHFPDAQVLIKPDDDPPGPASWLYAYKDLLDEVEPGGVVGAPQLNSGEFYFGVVKGDGVLIFPWELFSEDLNVVTTAYKGKKLIVAGSQEMNYIIAFEAKGQLGRDMLAVEGQFPIIMEDVKGNQFSIFGKVVSGPDIGSQLKAARGYRAKGFAWESIFSRVEIADN